MKKKKQKMMSEMEKNISLKILQTFKTRGQKVTREHRGTIYSVCVSRSVMSDSLQPQGLQPSRLLCSWNFPGKNTGVGSRSLLQRIFPPQGSNLGLLHCRRILYHLSHQGSHWAATLLTSSIGEIISLSYTSQILTYQSNCLPYTEILSIPLKGGNSTTVRRLPANPTVEQIVKGSLTPRNLSPTSPQL